MNISDYSLEGLEATWEYVDSFFDWDIPKNTYNEKKINNQALTSSTPEISEGEDDG